MPDFKKIIDRIPRRLQSLLRMLYYLPSELWDRMLGKHDANIPPRRLMFVGPGPFMAIGRHLVQLFKDHGNLQPSDHVLDIGCGVGRIALPLTHYLNAEGQYHGFDIVKDAINWCQKHISAQHPNFHFDHVDLYNKNYNARGRLMAIQHQFPYPQQSFDFAFATSLFTHMMPHEMQHYIGEMAKVIRKGGRCFCTFFILHRAALQVIEAGESHFPFDHDLGQYRVVNPAMPEQAIAFDEAFIRTVFQQHHLKIVEPIRYGSWSKNPKALSMQDIIIAIKE